MKFPNRISHAHLLDKKFMRNVFLSYGAQFLIILLGFISVTIITRYGGIHIYGMTTLLVALTNVLSGALSVRSNDAVVKFYSRGMAEGLPSLSKTALLLGFLLESAFGLLLFGLLWSFSPVIAIYILHDSSVVSQVSDYAFVALLIFMRGTSYGLLMAKEQFRTVQAVNLLEQIIRVGLLAIATFFFQSLQLQTIIALTLASSGFTTLIFFLYLVKDYFFSLRSVPVNFQYASEYLRFMGSSFVSSAIKSGNQGIDTLVLGALGGPTSAGIYGLFKQFLSPVMMMANPFSTQIAPKFVFATSENRKADVLRTINGATQILGRYFLVALVVIVPGAIFYSFWNKLHYESEHYAAFLVMILGSAVQLAQWWCRPFSIAVGIRYSLISNIVFTAAILLLIYPFTLFLGMLGAALAVTVSLTLVGLYWWRILMLYNR